MVKIYNTLPSNKKWCGDCYFHVGQRWFRGCLRLKDFRPLTILWEQFTSQVTSIIDNGDGKTLMKYDYTSQL